MEKSSIPLAQLFEPIRADLERVDLEFRRHVQSQVDLIPKIGQYIQTSGGKRNEPAYVARVVAALADIRQMPAGDLAERTTANFQTLFRP